MSQVSRRPIQGNTREKIDSLIYESFAICSSKNSVASFLNDLLTPTEKIMLAKRLAIAYLLIKGYSYTTISDSLKVSTTTIGTVSIMLKHRGTAIRAILGDIGRKQQWKNLFNELGELTVDLLGKGKGGNWKTAKSFEYQRKIAKQSPL